ncbi:hypothetical protein GF407_16160 [candidate division KSB1 bacterium]|nr:hypothetical protein [candidate division KSB1 bacterium]
MRKNYVETVIASVFIFSALTKIFDYENTALLIREICFLSVSIINRLLFGLIFIELIIAIWLLWVPFLRRYLYAFLFVLLMIFSIFGGYLMVAGFENCACFGTRIVSHPVLTIVKNLVMAAFLIYNTKSKG